MRRTAAGVARGAGDAARRLRRGWRSTRARSALKRLLPGWTARDLLTSLSVRIVAVTFIWAAIALPLVGLTLNAIYRERIQADFDLRLNQLTTLLIASSTIAPDSPPRRPEDLGELLFNIEIANGWYWQIEPVDEQGRPVRFDRDDTRAELWPLTSPSLRSQPLVIPRFAVIAPPAGGGRTLLDDGAIDAAVPAPDTADDPADDGALDDSESADASDATALFDLDLRGGERLRVAQEITFVADGSFTGGRFYRFTVTGNRDEVEQTVQSFSDKLAASLAVLALALLVLPLALVFVGLMPLKRIQTGLAKVRGGVSSRLEVDLPIEVRPLQVELNGLLDANTAIVERARTHVGNLAHGLKTPVSVLLNAAERNDPDLAERVMEQTRIMRDQVDHHLNRARTAARVKVLGVETPVHPVVTALQRTLSKLYPQRRIHVSQGLDDNVEPDLSVGAAAAPIFLGERQDLEEMLGNLLDNACKWACHDVAIAVRPIAQDDLDARARERGDGTDQFVLVIEDDGPGLTEAQAKAALKRGQRLDESTPGTGLGLAIVADTSALYGGTLRLSRSELGGLRAQVTLPCRWAAA